MRISIIVPSYNQASFLVATLDSLAAQRYPDLEVKIYDGGSNDGSAEILRCHSAGYPWISERDGGQAEAINRGLQETTGEVVAYLNSDDILRPGALDRVARHFREYPDCLALYGDADHIDAAGRVIERYGTEPWSYHRLQEVCFLCQPAVFWRRCLIEKYGILDDRLHFAMDYEYWLRLGRHVRFHHLAGEVLAGSRLHDATKTLSQRVRTHREILQVVLRHQGSSAAVWKWLQNLAFYDAAALAAPSSPLMSERRLFVPLFVAAVFRNAGRFGLRLSSEHLAELEGHLAAAGA